MVSGKDILSPGETSLRARKTIQVDMNWKNIIFFFDELNQKQTGLIIQQHYIISILSPRHTGPHFIDDNFKLISIYESVLFDSNSIEIYVPDCPITNMPALVLINWYQTSDKPLYESVMG